MRTGVNLFANIAGMGALAVAQLLFTPAYLHLVGLEAYALIAFFFTFQIFLQVFDFGMTPTVVRELGRMSASSSHAAEAGDLMRTVAAVYFGVAVAIGAGIVAAAPLIASNWLNPVTLTNSVVVQAIAHMGVALAIQWPVNLYQAGMRGLHKHVHWNVLRIIATFASNLLAILIMMRTRSVIGFFDASIAVSLIHLLFVRAMLWRAMPKGDRKPRVAWSSIGRIWPFAADMFAVTLAGVVVAQGDKIVVSGLLSLDAVAAYQIASVAASGLAVFSSPLFSTALPEFSAASGDPPRLVQLYRALSEAAAVLLATGAAALMIFPREIILLWTGNHTVAEAAAPLLVILAAGTALNGLMYVPWALQLSAGWSRVGVYFTYMNLVVFLVAIGQLTRSYGAAGAALTWLIVNALYAVIAIPVTHSRVLRGEGVQWAVRTAVPALGAFAVFASARFGIGMLSIPVSVPVLVLVVLAALSAAAMLAPGLRRRILHASIGA
jgi:O-antigen/teichoic acid export membrane protein